jgi:hypothetical protein
MNNMFERGLEKYWDMKFISVFQTVRSFSLRDLGAV